jgi:hypothetical protein
MSHSGMVDELLARLRSLPPDAQAKLVDQVIDDTRGMLFVPNPGPQTDAYLSKADVLLFGGEPAGGKSALGIGVALNSHWRSLLIRKGFSDLDGLLDTTAKLVGGERDLTRGSRPKYYKTDGGIIHFAGLPADGSIGTHQGVDHDYIYIDEAAQLPEKPVRMLMGWLRSDRPGQRCRVIMGSNPPLDPVGDWLIDFFGPWLNPTHPNPARPGELRYFLPDTDGRDFECAAGDTTMIAGMLVRAQSRTFIPSKLSDNPYYNRDEYAKTLAALPAAEREILMSGNFMLTRRDQPNQVIPTEWIKAAQARWLEHPKPNPVVPMSAMSIDCSGGGDDPAVIATRYDGFFPELIRKEGAEIPMHMLGATQAGDVVVHRHHDATVIVDMGGGYGGPVYEKLAENIGTQALIAYKGAEATERRTHDKRMGFVNVRSAAYWAFREALDPSQEGGSPVSLPPNPKLVTHLSAPTFTITPRGYKIEPKEDVVARLQSSTDEGDAVVMCWWAGPRNVVTVDVNSAEHGIHRGINKLRRAGGRVTADLGPRRRH